MTNEPGATSQYERQQTSLQTCTLGHHLFLIARLLLVNIAATLDYLKMILCNLCPLIRFEPAWDIFGSSSTRGSWQ